MDRYDYMSVVNDIFSECKDIDEINQRYEQMKIDLQSLYIQEEKLRRLKLR